MPYKSQTSIVVRVIEMREKLTAGDKPYLALKLRDSNQTQLSAKCWNSGAKKKEAFENNSYVRIVGERSVYNGNDQITVASVEANVEDVEIQEFYVYSPLTPARANEIFTKFFKVIGESYPDTIMDVIKRMYKRYADRLFISPAASFVHHDHIGGLAEHVVSMLKLSEKIMDNYDVALNNDSLYTFDFDRALVYAGIFLHDICKIDDFDNFYEGTKNTQAFMINHINNVNSLIDRFAYEGEYHEKEEIMLLKHIVLSHHGKAEWGANVIPMTPEAMMVHLVDYYDSKLASFSKGLRDVEPGGLSKKQYMLDGRFLYKPTTADPLVKE